MRDYGDSVIIERRLTDRLDLQQVGCFLVLAEELHFGRTASRLGYSQSRVSQLLAALETRVGARLVARTSRRVALTAAGARFEADLRPAFVGFVRTYEQAQERARRGAVRELRVGFAGMVYEDVSSTFRALRQRHGVTVHTQDLPFGSPFDAVHRRDVDAALVELPVREPELTVGYRFPKQDQHLVLGCHHPYADRTEIDVEDLAHIDLLHREGVAPDYWRAAMTPRVTPSGRPISSSTSISTLQQGLALTASGPFALLVCQPLAVRLGRTDLRSLPVRGLESSSQLALVWHRDSTDEPLIALAALLREDTARSIASERGERA